MSQKKPTNSTQIVCEEKRKKSRLGRRGATSAENLPEDAVQLTKLGGVLNGLKRGASAMRSRMAGVMTAVRNGTYRIDPVQVSRSIVGESLAAR